MTNTIMVEGTSIIDLIIDTNAAVGNVIPSAKEAVKAFNKTTELPAQYQAIQNCITLAIYAACANGEMKAKDAARMLVYGVWGIPKGESEKSVQERFDLLLGELGSVYAGSKGNVAENLTEEMDKKFVADEAYRQGVLLFQKNALACGKTENAGVRRSEGDDRENLYDPRVNGSVLNSDQVGAFVEGWRTRVLPAQQAFE